MGATNAENALPKTGAKRRLRQQEILSLAAKLIASQGFAAMRMDTLAFELNINKATLYYYYRSKNDLLFEICAAQIDRACSSVEKASKASKAADGLAEIIEASMRLVRERPQEARVFFQEQAFFRNIFSDEQQSRIDVGRDKYLSAIRAVVDTGVGTGEISRQMASPLPTLLLATLHGLSEIAASAGDLEAWVSAAQDVLLRGVLAGAGGSVSSSAASS